MWPAIYKQKAKRYQGLVSTQGAEAFEDQRRALARVVGWEPWQISDGDVFEFLARLAADGEDAVVRELERMNLPKPAPKPLSRRKVSRKTGRARSPRE